MVTNKSILKNISILICSRDRRNNLEKLVGSLKRMDTTQSYEIIVVEETHNPIPIKGVHYISHPKQNRGIPYARNLALAHANGEIIVFIDDDCIIQDKWLDNLLEPLKEDSVVGVQGGVNVPESTNPIGWAESILGVPGGGIRRVLRAKGQVQETKEISTLNCAYRMWAVNKVGGFEKELKLTGEDYILAKQVSHHGRCLFVPGAMVYHEARGQLIKIWHWFVRRGRAEIDVIRTRKLENANFSMVLKRSLFIKLCALIILGLVFSDIIVFWVLTAILGYGGLQYVRYYITWRDSPAKQMAFVMLPVVKLTMDIAMDWGRFRGLFFD
jgi:GT2 family glycosyltransferase